MNTDQPLRQLLASLLLFLSVPIPILFLLPLPGHQNLPSKLTPMALRMVMARAVCVLLGEPGPIIANFQTLYQVDFLNMNC